MKGKINITKVLLFITILSLENFGCLLPASDYMIPSLIKYSDLGIMFSILFFLWVYLLVKPKNKDIKIMYPYKWIILLFIIMIFISSFMAKIYFNQPISWGVRSLRQIITCFLLYFPISKALQCEVITKNDLKKYIIIISTFEMVLYTIQYMFINKVVFLNFAYDNVIEMRLGHRRLRYPIELPILSTFLVFNNLLNSKGYKLKNIMYILWFAFILIIMVQKRTQILSFLLTIALIFVLWRKKAGTKIIITSVVFTLLIGFALNSSIVQSAIYSATNRGSSDDTLTIRENGIEYYKERVKESPIFGFGHPNVNCNNAMIASGVNHYYFLADDGIYGFYYIFGITGLIWLSLFWIKNLKYSYILYKKINYVYILYFIYETFELYIGMKWYYYWPLAIALCITLLSDEVLITKKEEVKQNEC